MPGTKHKKWPPGGGRRLTTIDAHAAGEPLRTVVGGFPDLPGATMLEKRRYAREHCDELRRVLIGEPRGHSDMYGCVPVPPVTDDGDFGVLFLHNEGYSTMCGHGIIAVITTLVECGALEVDPDDPVVRVDTPAGRVTARAHLAGPRVASVSFENVPSFLLLDAAAVDVPGIGTLRCDVAFGGAFYAYVAADDAGVTLSSRHADRIIEAGMRIKRAVAGQCAIEHPDGDPDLSFLYGTIFVAPAQGSAHSRNACVFADGELDRSPTGTGVSGRIAIHHARGEVATGETIEIESVLGTTFAVRVARTTRVGDRDAVVPEVTGAAFLTGRHEFWIDPDDPLGGGFFVGGTSDTA